MNKEHSLDSISVEENLNKDPKDNDNNLAFKKNIVIKNDYCNVVNLTFFLTMLVNTF